jgi:Effector-associated domain 11
MRLIQFKQEVKNLIVKDIKGALEYLNQKIKTESELTHKIILFKSSLIDGESRYQLNLITPDEFRVIEQRIRSSVLSFLKELSEQDLNIPEIEFEVIDTTLTVKSFEKKVKFKRIYQTKGISREMRNVLEFAMKNNLEYRQILIRSIDSWLIHFDDNELMYWGMSNDFVSQIQDINLRGLSIKFIQFFPNNGHLIVTSEFAFYYAHVPTSLHEELDSMYCYWKNDIVGIAYFDNHAWAIFWKDGRQTSFGVLTEAFQNVLNSIRDSKEKVKYISTLEQTGYFIITDKNIYYSLHSISLIERINQVLNRSDLIEVVTETTNDNWVIISLIRE